MDASLLADVSVQAPAPGDTPSSSVAGVAPPLSLDESPREAIPVHGLSTLAGRPRLHSVLVSRAAGHLQVPGDRHDVRLGNRSGIGRDPRPDVRGGQRRQARRLVHLQEANLETLRVTRRFLIMIACMAGGCAALAVILVQLVN